jgi:hypothetical protein
MLRHATNGWFIYYVEDGELFPFGVLNSKESAIKEMEILQDLQPKKGWKCRSIIFVGWGDVVFASNETPTFESMAVPQ